MTLCKFCGHELDRSARKKCAVCGEPQGWRTYPSGMVLKYVPLGSILVAVLSLGFARLESLSASHARAQAETAQSSLHATQIGAERAMADLTRQVPESLRTSIRNNVGLPLRTTLEQIERQAQEKPANAELQRKAFLYRALKQPD